VLERYLKENSEAVANLLGENALYYVKAYAQSLKASIAATKNGNLLK
jgi:hypothetical protein